MGLVLVLVVMGVVGAHIHMMDVRQRVVPSGDLAVLCGMRVVLCVASWGAQWCGKSAWVGLDGAVWGGVALIQQGLRGGALVVLVMGINCVLSRKQRSEAIGAGDVKLYFVCCLYLNEAATVLFLIGSTCVGFLQALRCLIVKRHTFAFAPALVWSCYGAFLVQEPYFSQFLYFFSHQLVSWV